MLGMGVDPPCIHVAASTVVVVGADGNQHVAGAGAFVFGLVVKVAAAKARVGTMLCMVVDIVAAPTVDGLDSNKNAARAGEFVVLRD